MMLRNLVDEVMRRRLWPIAALAVLVALATPLLFLQSAPSDAPVASAPAGAIAPTAELPARAQRLLATGASAEQGASRKPSGRANDPFQAPSSHAAKSSGKAAAGRSATSSGERSAGAASEPVPVVITNADGTNPATSTTPGTTSSPCRSATPRPATWPRA